MIDLNVRALTLMTKLVLPYMGRGSEIINTSSIASFCPNTRLNVYSATKAYVTSFSRGLAAELRARDITVCAVCPGPMKTDFITRGEIAGHSRTFDLLPYCDVRRCARGALLASAAGCEVYTPTPFYKLYRALAKILPVRVTVRIAGA